MASGNIKGITIEFKGDTTQLNKALSSVNKEIRQTDSALREVDKALKLDPTNVELLAQREALLAKQIEQTKDKLELQKRFISRTFIGKLRQKSLSPCLKRFYFSDIHWLVN